MKKISKEEIQKAAEAFRKNARTCYQFLRSDKIIRENIEFQDLDHNEGDTKTLYINMVLLGLDEAIAFEEKHKYHFKDNGLKRSQTHHVIPKSMKDMVQKYNIHVDDGRNGIILPHQDNCECNFAIGVVHGRKHCRTYNDEIKERISNCKTADEVWAVVDIIKQELYDHKLFLQAGHSKFNDLPSNDSTKHYI